MLRERLSQLYMSCDKETRKRLFEIAVAWDKGDREIPTAVLPLLRERAAKCECRKRRLHKAATRQWNPSLSAKAQLPEAQMQWLNAVAALAIIESLANAAKALRAANDNEWQTIATRVRISLVVTSNLLRQVA